MAKGVPTSTCRDRPKRRSRAEDLYVSALIVGFRPGRCAALGAEILVEISGRQHQQQPLACRSRLTAMGAIKQRGLKGPVLVDRAGCGLRSVRRSHPPRRRSRPAGLGSVVHARHDRILWVVRDQGQYVKRPRQPTVLLDRPRRLAFVRDFLAASIEPPNGTAELDHDVHGKTHKHTIVSSIAPWPEFRRMQHHAQRDMPSKAQTNREDNPLPHHGILGQES